MSRRALLDVNVLIALLDPAHIHHGRVHGWIGQQARSGWASCPITQNGFVRIVSQPTYPNSLSAAEASSLLRMNLDHRHHEFWPDSISLLDATWLDCQKLSSHRHVTDSYLLALANAHGGVLATLDSKLNSNPVVGGLNHLLLIK